MWTDQQKSAMTTEADALRQELANGRKGPMVKWWSSNAGGSDIAELSLKIAVSGLRPQISPPLNLKCCSRCYCLPALLRTRYGQEWRLPEQKIKNAFRRMSKVGDVPLDSAMRRASDSSPSLLFRTRSFGSTVMSPPSTGGTALLEMIPDSSESMQSYDERPSLDIESNDFGGDPLTPSRRTVRNSTALSDVDEDETVDVSHRDDIDLLVTEYAAFSPCIVHWAVYEKAKTELAKGNYLRPQSEPMMHTFHATLFMVDISGFTLLSQRLDAEELKLHCNGYFTKLIDIIVKWGGDVIKFLGDALFVTYATKPDADIQTQQCNAYYAVCCAQEIMEKCGTYKAGELLEDGTNAVDLTIHCGIGVGLMHGFCVGACGRWEYVIAGEPIEQIKCTEPVAVKGQVVISAQVLSLVADLVLTLPIISDDGGGDAVEVYLLCAVYLRSEEFVGELVCHSLFRKDNPWVLDKCAENRQMHQAVSNVLRGSSDVATKKEAMLSAMDSVEEGREEAQGMVGDFLRLQAHRASSLMLGTTLGSVLQTYVHETARLAIESVNPRATMRNHWLDMVAELRTVITIFVDVIGLDAEFTAGRLHMVQKTMEVAMLTWSRFEGTLRQFCVDDKGVVLIGAFGLPGFHHEDNEARAISSAMELRSGLMAIGLKSKIGIAKGEKVFCGLVGHPRLRCEYAMMGPSVNLAARLMGKAKENCIIVPESVQLAADHLFEFASRDKVNAKGYTDPIAIFEPMGAKTEHHEYAISGKGSTQDEGVLTLGRDAAFEAIRQISEALVDRVASVEEGAQRQPSLAFVEGPHGVGKSYLLNACLNATTAKYKSLKVINVAASKAGRDAHYSIWKEVLCKLACLKEDPLNPPSQALKSENIRHTIEAILKLRHEKDDIDDMIQLLDDVFHFPDILHSDADFEEHHLEDSQRVEDLTAAVKELMRCACMGLKYSIVLMVEHAHWMDVYSQQLLVSFCNGGSADSDGADGSKAFPYLILAAWRTEGVARGCIKLIDSMLGNSSQCLHLKLENLDKEATAAFARAIILESNLEKFPEMLPDTVEAKEQLHNLTLGSPILIRRMAEVVKDAYFKNGEVKKLLAVAAMGQETFWLSEFDQLPMAERDVLKAASVVGNEFHERVLGHLIKLNGGQESSGGTGLHFVSASLKSLIRRKFISLDPVRGPNGAHYKFEHHEARDAIYKTLTHHDRVKMHRIVADSLAKMWDKHNERRPDPSLNLATLIDHLEHSENLMRFFKFVQQKAASERDAFRTKEAIGMFSRLICKAYTLEWATTLDEYSISVHFARQQEGSPQSGAMYSLAAQQKLKMSFVEPKFFDVNSRHIDEAHVSPTHVALWLAEIAAMHLYEGDLFLAHNCALLADIILSKPGRSNRRKTNIMGGFISGKRSNGPQKPGRDLETFHADMFSSASVKISWVMAQVMAKRLNETGKDGDRAALLKVMMQSGRVFEHWRKRLVTLHSEIAGSLEESEEPQIQAQEAPESTVVHQETLARVETNNAEIALCLCAQALVASVNSYESAAKFLGQACEICKLLQGIERAVHKEVIRFENEKRYDSLARLDEEESNEGSAADLDLVGTTTYIQAIQWTNIVQGKVAMATGVLAASAGKFVLAEADFAVASEFFKLKVSKLKVDGNLPHFQGERDYQAIAELYGHRGVIALLCGNAVESVRFFKVQQQSARKQVRNALLWSEAEAWFLIIGYLGGPVEESAKKEQEALALELAEVRKEGRIVLENTTKTSKSLKSNELVVWSIVDTLRCLHQKQVQDAYRIVKRGCEIQQKRLAQYSDGVILYLLLHLCLDLLELNALQNGAPSPGVEPQLTAGESDFLRRQVGVLSKVGHA
jgi:class 3 adenylate cyclase